MFPFQVMWVRRTTEKVSLLTVGNITYSGDPRVRVKFQYPNNWRLLINPTQREDAGVYMCQVSTHPPRVFTTNLTILGKYAQPHLVAVYSHTYVNTVVTESSLEMLARQIPLHSSKTYLHAFFA